MSLSVKVIKKYLENNNYTNPDVVSMTKNLENCTQWLFNTDQGKVIVGADVSGTRIVVRVKPDSFVGLQKMKEISLKIVDRPDNQGEPDMLRSFIKKLNIKSFKIYAIPSIDIVMSSHKYTESVLVVSSKYAFVCDTYSGDIVDINKFVKVKRDLLGLWFNTDLDIDDDNHIKMSIPKYSVMTCISDSGYTKVIALSPDLTHGLSSVNFGYSPIINSEKKDLIDVGFLSKEIIHDKNHENYPFMLQLQKLFDSYDFTNYYIDNDYIEDMRFTNET